MKLTENQKILFAAVSDIEDRYIEKIDKKRAHLAVRFLKGIAVGAAVLAILFGLAQIIPASVFFSGSGRFLAPDIPEGLFFVVTAHATDGKTSGVTSVIPDWMFSSILPGLSSGGSAGSRFPDKPENIPFFSFVVHLPGPGEDYIMSIGYDDIVSYAGIIPSGDMGPNFDDLTGQLDKHVAYHVVSYDDTENRQAFRVGGWFTDSKILHLKLYRRADGVLLQEQSVQVEYNSLFQKYNYTVLDSKIYTDGG